MFPLPLAHVPARAQVVCTGWVIRPRRNISEVSDKKCQAAFVALARPKEGECTRARAHNTRTLNAHARARRWADDRRVAAPRLLHESRSAARAAAAGLTPYPIHPPPRRRCARPRLRSCAAVRGMHASRARACRWAAAAAAAGGRAEEDVRAGRRDAPTGNARADACARGWTRCGAGLAAAPHGWRFREVACCPLSVACCPLHVARCPLHAVRCTLSVARCS